MSKLEAESSVETEAARKNRLGQFVVTHFSDVCPPVRNELAVDECIGFEDRSREMWEDPTLILTDEDAQDPTLRKTIEEKISLTIEVAANEETITELTADRDRKATTRDETVVERDRVAEERERVNAERTALEANVASAERTLTTEKSREADKEADLKAIEQAQSQKGAKGTIGVLKMLLECGRLKSPEMRGKVQQVLAQLQSLANMGSTPEAQTFFRQAVEQNSVNFVGSSPNQIYASLISHIDAGLASGAITESDANAARVTLGVSPKTSNEPYKIPKDSSQMARDLRERRNTEKQVPKIDPATGEPMRDDDGNIIYETVIEENNDIIPIDHPSLNIYLKPEPGSDAYYVHILSESRLPLVERIDADNFAMGGMNEINYLVATADMEQQGYTDMFGSQFTSNEVRRHNYENFVRATGMNPDFGNLWTTEHSDRIRQMMQMLHPRGDLGRDDVNPQNWKVRATELGVYDPEADQWDYDALTLWRNSKTFDTVGKDGDALIRSGEAA
ncbi:hypothetical protein [Cohaesibacter gelatinilyticus]|nr:hypothetical protein [Cohaesibacter gelatinilyticus]